jgi:hypothetical protein
MMKKTKRQTIREIRRKRQNRTNYFAYGSLGITVVVIVVVVIATLSSSPGPAGLMGQEVPNLSRNHISEDTVPGPYATNPPAGGAHYPDTLPTKFYQESDVAGLPKHPEGYLVHNLEHGYVIFWYNCQAPNTDCAALKQDIQSVINQEGSTKLIAFPWPSMDVPLAMTSWGRILKFTTPDVAQMKLFVQRNRYQAPEANAQ